MTPARDLPATWSLPFPTGGPLRMGRRAALAALRRYWDVQVHGVAHVPRQGPVILAPNHIGTLDGPLIALVPPRPVHALAKDELFHGALGAGLRAVGQISLARAWVDVNAIRRAVHVLRCGRALAIFPEGERCGGSCADLRPGVAYLALATGAPIVPVAFLGTRQPGTHRTATPPRGATMHVTFGAPFSVGAQPWPRRRQDLADAMAVVGPRLRDHIAWAQEHTGMGLPGRVRELAGDAPAV